MCELCKKASQIAGKPVTCKICWRKANKNKKRAK